MSDGEDTAEDEAAAVLGIFRPRGELINLSPGGQRYRQPAQPDARPRRRVRSLSTEDEEDSSTSVRARGVGRGRHRPLTPSLLEDEPDEYEDRSRSPISRKGYR